MVAPQGPPWHGPYLCCALRNSWPARRNSRWALDLGIVLILGRALESNDRILGNRLGRRPRPLTKMCFLLNSRETVFAALFFAPHAHTLVILGHYFVWLMFFCSLAYY